MPYALRRPAERTGAGELAVYRAISRHDQPLKQTPVGWVRRQRAFDELSQDPDPERAAALAADGVRKVAKVWTELAYERIRTEVAPEWPSRLDSLYAFADPLEAFAFTRPKHSMDVWEGVVLDDARWGIVDMWTFEVVHPKGAIAPEFERAWETACAHAREYWANGPQEIRRPEILVAGPVMLNRQIYLLDTLRELGLLE